MRNGKARRPGRRYQRTSARASSKVYAFWNGGPDGEDASADAIDFACSRVRWSSDVLIQEVAADVPLSEMPLMGFTTGMTRSLVERFYKRVNYRRGRKITNPAPILTTASPA